MKKRRNTPVLKCVHLLRGTCFNYMLLKDFLTWKFVVDTIAGPCVVQLRERVINNIVNFVISLSYPIVPSLNSLWSVEFCYCY